MYVGCIFIYLSIVFIYFVKVNIIKRANETQKFTLTRLGMVRRNTAIIRPVASIHSRGIEIKLKKSTSRSIMMICHQLG